MSCASVVLEVVRFVCVDAPEALRPASDRETGSGLDRPAKHIPGQRRVQDKSESVG